MLIRLRKLRDKMNLGLGGAKLDKSQDSGSLTSNGNSVKHSTKRKVTSKHMSLTDKLKLGL
jgi:hypothetical protein